MKLPRLRVTVVVWLTFATGAAVAAALALLQPRSKPGVTEGHFKLLKPGMMRADVEHLLHGPPRNDLGHTAIVWVPRAAGKRVSAWFEPASPAADILVREDLPKGGRMGLTATPIHDFFPGVATKGGHQALWVTGTGLIAVYYGRDGSLQGKYFSGVDEHVPPSLTDWLASRPRMICRSLGL
jgi:hypothetical protein